MDTYWITVAVKAPSLEAAEEQAKAIVRRKRPPGRVVQVDREPPQGSLIVGDMHEDEL